MANLKKVLAGSLSLCLAASMFTACGSSDSSSTPDAKGGSTSKAGNNTGINNSSDRVNTAELHGVDSSEDSKKTLTIYCWNTEFKSRLDKYYPQGTSNELTYNELADGSKEIATINGVKLNWVQVENEGNAYQTKLDEALKGQQDSTEKVDMFLMEADYALKYANGDVALSIQDLGITDDDMSQMYQYTKDVATDTKTGELKGVSWQATPGLFLYNTKIAEDVLGTSDPEKVQEAVKDWDTFTATAQKMADKGYKMVSGFDDTYRCFSNNMSSPWVTDNKITVDPQIKAWADQTKEYTDKGYNNKTSLWDDAWAAGQKIDGGVFGYFFSTWGIPFTLLPNTVDEEIKADGSNAKEGNGGYGLWKACSGPQAYYWGGTWICGAIDSDNQDIVADIMKVMTCNKDVAKAITEGEQDYTNNKAAIKELIDGGYTNAFLGGQNHLALLTEAADKISLENKLSAYDQGCNEKFQGAMKDYFLGTVDSYEAALENFKKNITDLYGNLTCDF
jgi:multiple sugar transport system substrate-binding protein